MHNTDITATTLIGNVGLAGLVDIVPDTQMKMARCPASSTNASQQVDKPNQRWPVCATGNLRECPTPKRGRTRTAWGSSRRRHTSKGTSPAGTLLLRAVYYTAGQSTKITHRLLTVCAAYHVLLHVNTLPGETLRGFSCRPTTFLGFLP